MIACFGSLEDSLSQSAHVPFCLAPVNTIPVGWCLGSVHAVSLRYLTFPWVSRFHRVLQAVHQDRFSRLSTWVLPYPAGYAFTLIFRSAGFRFSAPPHPAGEFGSLTVRLLEYSRLHRGFHVLLSGDPIRVGALCTPGSWCHNQPVKLAGGQV